MYCKHCGNEIETADSNFCPKCGELVNEEKPAQIRKKRDRGWYLAPILFSLIGGLVAYFVVRKDDPILARNCLILGFVIFIIVFAIYGSIGAYAFIYNLVR